MDSFPIILIGDPDSRTLESYKQDPLVKKIPFYGALFGMEAQRVLADKSQKICGVFLSPDMDSTNVFSVIQSALFHRPTAPIYFLGSAESYPAFAEISLKKLGVKGWVPKAKLQYRNLVELVAPLSIRFQAQSVIQKSDGALLGQEMMTADREFVSISAQDFISGSTSCFDVYLRLKSGKYLKILLAGDTFTVERIQNYLDKGVQEFYLRKDSQQDYVHFCDSISQALLNHPKAPLSIKAGKILSQGTETFSFLFKQGVSEQSLREGVKFISNVRHLVQQTGIQSNEHVNQLLTQVKSAEHSAATTLLSAMLCQALEIQMERPVQIVGGAAMLHHIGLMSLPEKLWDEDESKMTREEIELYRTHPEIGARILRQIKGVDAAAIQAVEQHHLRKDGKGFPSNLSSIHMNRVAEIVGICSEYAHRIKRAQIQSNDHLQQEIEQEVLPRFSKQIAYAFRTVFFPRVSILKGN